jgi:hypothetical protein
MPGGKLVFRSRKTEVFAQCAPLVGGAEQPSTLQFRNDQRGENQNETSSGPSVALVSATNAKSNSARSPSCVRSRNDASSGLRPARQPDAPCNHMLSGPREKETKLHHDTFSAATDPDYQCFNIGPSPIAIFPSRL